MSSKPASSSSHSSSSQGTDLLPGTLVHYDDEGQLILAVVVGTKKDKISILTLRGRELDLIRARLYVLPGKLMGDVSSTTARVARLQEIAQQVETQAGTFDVAELWSFVHEESRAFTVSELSSLYLGVDELVNHAAIRVALVREKMHFKRDRDCFEPRPQHVVEDLRRAEEAKALKHAMRERSLEFLEARARDTSIAIPADLRDSFQLIEEVAASIVHTDPARQKEAREFVHVCGDRLGLPESMPVEKRAFEILRKVGIFNEHSNLALIRHNIPTEHSAEADAEIGVMHVPETVASFSEDERAFRRDLTSQAAFTIDDISTLDMDDALSLQRTPDGYELGIHITDVTAAVIPGSRTDRAAKRRATSLYCADRTINMLPLRLAEDICSLRAGVVRPCLSVLVSLSESLDVLSTEVCGSFVRVARRYTYDEVDDLLEAGDTTLLVLHEIAAALEGGRIRNGAMRVHKREVVPFFEDGKVRLLEIEEDSPARLLVSEMMVLANTVMAEFAAKHRIPVLFRGQERPDDRNDEVDRGADAPEGPAKDFSARTKLKKSSVSFEPIRHSGLGVDSYIQATSPIRRYMDLCHQRQILSFLKEGKACIAPEEFERIAAEVELPLQAAGLASRETKRYWLLRYLEQRERNKPIEGTVVRVDLKTPLVELDEVYMTVLVRFQQKVSLGQRVTLRVTAVDAHADYVRLSS
jgi:exoribonuclease-2